MKYKPMLAEEFDGNIYKTKEEYWYEIKLDGGRCIADNNGSSLGTVMWTRSGNHLNNQFPLIFKGLRKQPQGTFDGEIVVFKDGFTKFPLFMKRAGTSNPISIDRMAKSIPAVFMVFDILELEGKPLIDKPLYERKSILQDVLVEDEYIKYTPHYFSHEELMDTVNLEGIMLKDPKGKYDVGKRSRNWLKFKFRKETVLTIISYEEHPKGILMYSEDGHKVNCNGNISKIGKKLLDDGKIFKIETSYLERTKEGHLRDPAFKRYILS